MHTASYAVAISGLAIAMTQIVTLITFLIMMTPKTQSMYNPRNEYQQLKIGDNDSTGMIFLREVTPGFPATLFSIDIPDYYDNLTQYRVFEKPMDRDCIRDLIATDKNPRCEMRFVQLLPVAMSEFGAHIVVTVRRPNMTIKIKNSIYEKDTTSIGMLVIMASKTCNVYIEKQLYWQGLEGRYTNPISTTLWHKQLQITQGSIEQGPAAQQRRTQGQLETIRHADGIADPIFLRSRKLLEMAIELRYLNILKEENMIKSRVAKSPRMRRPKVSKTMKTRKKKEKPAEKQNSRKATTKSSTSKTTTSKDAESNIGGSEAGGPDMSRNAGESETSSSETISKVGSQNAGKQEGSSKAIGEKARTGLTAVTAVAGTTAAAYTIWYLVTHPITITVLTVAMAGIMGIVSWKVYKQCPRQPALKHTENRVTIIRKINKSDKEEVEGTDMVDSRRITDKFIMPEEVSEQSEASKPAS